MTELEERLREQIARIIEPELFVPWEGWPLGQAAALAKAEAIQALYADRLSSLSSDLGRVKEALEPGDIEWLRRQLHEGHCGEGTLERSQRQRHNDRIERLLSTLSRRGGGGEEGGDDTPDRHHAGSPRAPLTGEAEPSGAQNP